MIRPIYSLSLLVTITACSGGGGSSTPPSPATSVTAPGTSSNNPANAGTNFATLEQNMIQRRDDYLRIVAQGFGNKSENYYTQLARLETGIGPLDTQPLEDMMDFMDSRRDTSDFKATALLRLLYLHDQNTMLPAAIKTRGKQTLLNFKYWIDEPGQDEMVFWSENHQILFASAEYLAGQRYPNDIFSNDGKTGAQHKAKARARILQWIDWRLRFGYSEWNSPVYYPHDIAPLLNLIDFASDSDIQMRAAMALDILLFDIARLTQNGSFGLTAGRVYEEHKWSGRRQSMGDLVEILWGTRGEFRSRGSTAATAFATSRNYKVPHVLLGIGLDKPQSMVDRARVGLSTTAGPGEGIGFSRLDHGMFWWGQGGYIHKDTIRLSRKMIKDWDLWHYGTFAPFSQVRNVPDFLFPSISNFLSPVTEGSFLGNANLYSYRTPDAMMSSAQDYRKGQVGFQQHAWQATLDMDAMVWTTAPASLGRKGPGEWTGSASLPRIVQSEGTCLILYNPPIVQRLAFPQKTHAYFPKSGFDEVLAQGSWHFARKNKGYLALYSAHPTYWQTSGSFADKELIANGSRNAWICHLGREAEDGSFAAFQAKILAAQVSVVGQNRGIYDAPFELRFDIPGKGIMELKWIGQPTLAGQALPTSSFPRFDNPYSQKAFSDKTLTIDFAGASLNHNQITGIRSGDGL